ncbi:Cytochrome P450 CYP4/CYP19/CYP26 subfamily [Handroanthus impetiginosus]|uniref:Cytochrome P450 CYP4/CYP19/CYP26 subfamily n=1 Tax=Handroanthus impetiginosus TaxID=429701 RepID=A0A2G9G739_9LAMI|nr:Cytochrome P450 CYP4/CYP19/CYP26 subfamily [Handroanthus impetiginosus]
MEMKFITESLNLYLVAAIILYFWVCRIVNCVWLKPRRLEKWLKSEGFKGNPYRLWYGDLKDVAKMTMDVQAKAINLEDDIDSYVFPFHHHIVQKYGKRCYMWNGAKPRIFVMDPVWIREVLQKHEIFVRLYTNPLNKLLITGLFLHEGESWARKRRILNSAFTITKLKDMISVMHISCVELVEKWQSMFSDKGSVEVDVWPYFSDMSADVISRTAFGSNYERGQKIFLLQKEQGRLVTNLSRSIYIPGLRFLPTKTNKRMKEISKEIEAIMIGIITRKEEAMKRARDLDDKSSIDLLGILLEINYEEQKNGNGKEVGMTIEEVIEECKLFYLAGQETTSTLLVWTMVLLSIHQNWQVQAREEVLEVLGKRKPDFDGLLQLKKVHMILCEVLRLYSSAPLIVRVTAKEIKLGDVTLPKGLELALPLLFAHHDKEIWGEDANEFKPERFAQGVTKAAKDGQLGAFFPFGLGPRICIGQNFAMVEAKMALALILQRFSFELSPSYEHAPVQVITLQPKYGAKIILSKI